MDSYGKQPMAKHRIEI